MFKRFIAGTFLLATTIGVSACQTTGGNLSSSAFWTSEPIKVGAETTQNSGSQKFQITGNKFVAQTSTGPALHEISSVNRCTGHSVQHKHNIRSFGIQSGAECLIGYGTPVKAGQRTLTVILHGDTYYRGSSKSVGKFFQIDMVKGLDRLFYGSRIVSIIRPGEKSLDGYSSGNNGGGRDNHTTYAIDTIAAGIKTLLDETKVDKLFIVSQSGGSIIASVLINRHPSLAGKIAVYAGGLPGFRDEWRSYKAATYNAPIQLTLKKGEDPSKNVDYIAKHTLFWAATPKGDQNTLPEFGEKYIQLLKQKGVNNARFILVDGDKHYFSLSRNWDHIDALYSELLHS